MKRTDFLQQQVPISLLLQKRARVMNPIRILDIDRLPIFPSASGLLAYEGIGDPPKGGNPPGDDESP